MRRGSTAWTRQRSGTRFRTITSTGYSSSTANRATRRRATRSTAGCRLRLPWAGTQARCGSLPAHVLRLSGRRRGGDADALHLAPGRIAAEILPHPLQPPDHLELPVREVLEETEANQTRDVAPVVIPAIGDLLLQH